MTESLATPSNAKPIADAEETLRLKCDQCGGGLVLKRRHLGIKGQCVHCQVPLMAVEQDGVVRVVSERPDPIPASEPSEDAGMEMSGMATSDVEMPDTTPVVDSLPEIPASEAPTLTNEEEPVLPWGIPAPAESVETSAAEWAPPAGFDFPLEPSAPEAPLPWGPPAGSDAAAPAFEGGFTAPELQPPLPTRDGDNLFGGKPEGFPPVEAPASAPVNASPFGDQAGGFSLSFPSMFGAEESGAAVAPAWGTNVPKEGHASISPFGTGTAGEGFAESLYREKVEKENASHHAVAMPTFATPSPADGGPFAEQPAKRDCEEKVILDGDGRPMRPMTKEEEEEFAKNFFKYDNARSTPRWVKRLRKTAKRFLIFFCILGAGGGGVAAFTPKEQLLEWKKKTIEWLEPGMAVLDYLPEKWRPKWLPQSKFGIDAGVDENGQPKKKMNAFEGLDKLKGDIGNMRGAADAELEGLKQF